LDEEGVESSDFSIVDQSKCIADSNLNVKIDEETFSAGNVADVVKKVHGHSSMSCRSNFTYTRNASMIYPLQVGGVIGTGVEKAGDVLGTGITKASDLGSGLIRSYGEEGSTQKVPKKNLNDLYRGAKDRENDANPDAEWIQ